MKNDTEVTVTGASGSVLASCSCGQPTPYHEAAAFMARAQDLVAKGDWQGLAAVTNFPVRTPVGSISSAATFVARAPAIFTAAMRAAIADAEPKAVFCNAQGFMLGDGVLWASADASGHVGLITVNKPVP